MSQFYRRIDAPLLDYELGTVPGAGDVLFRGPIPDLGAPYVAVVGGAQTFGRFVDRPFPALLAERLGLPCLNLGIGGAGPRFALGPDILPLLQGARLVIVQVFSGRSSSTSQFDNQRGGRNFGSVLANNRWVAYEDYFRHEFERGDRELTERIVAETRDDFGFMLAELGRLLRVPAVLLWLSRRVPDYEIDWSTTFGILNDYPQLIDRAVLDRVTPHFSGYVECASTSGLPQRLWRADEAVAGTNREESGWLVNVYYPSPEMHREAADLLEPVCRRLL